MISLQAVERCWKTDYYIPARNRVELVKVKYHPGVFAVYKALDLPVVPVALNSGLFWPKQSFKKKSGIIN